MIRLRWYRVAETLFWEDATLVMAYSIRVLSRCWRGFEGLRWSCSSLLMVAMRLNEAPVSVKAAPVFLKEVPHCLHP